MISKEKFLNYCERVERTEKGILEIEKAFGDIVLRERDFCALSNYADTIAADLIGVPEGWRESFVTDFWNIIDTGKSECDITYPDGNEEHIVMEGFEGFYDYWRKEVEEIEG